MATKPADYVKFIQRVQAIVESHGKHMVGWEEIARAKLDPRTIAQHWNPGRRRARCRPWRRSRARR